MIRQFPTDAESGPLDCLLVDLPPGTGDEALTVGGMLPDADGGITVTAPQEASLSVCRQAISLLKAVDLPCLAIIGSMSGFVWPHGGERTPIPPGGGGEEMATQMHERFLGCIPLAPEVTALADQGLPLLSPGAPEAVRSAFDGVVEKLLVATG